MVNFITKNWEIKDITTVLFDKDGTFLDDNIYWGKLAELRVKAIIKYFDLDENLFEKLCFLIGHNPNTCSLIKNGAIGVLSRNEVIDFVVNNLKQYKVTTNTTTISNIFDDVHKKFLQEIEKYVEFLPHSEMFIKELKAYGIKMAVVTSDTVDHTQKILNILKINDCFDCVIGKDSCDETKKTGKPALLALEKLNSTKQETIVIGDALMDYLMSKNANLKDVILVATGQTDIEELKKYSQHTINNLSEVTINNAT